MFPVGNCVSRGDLKVAALRALRRIDVRIAWIRHDEGSACVPSIRRQFPAPAPVRFQRSLGPPPKFMVLRSAEEVIRIFHVGRHLVGLRLGHLIAGRASHPYCPSAYQPLKTRDIPALSRYSLDSTLPRDCFSRRL